MSAKGGPEAQQQQGHPWQHSESRRRQQLEVKAEGLCSVLHHPRAYTHTHIQRAQKKLLLRQWWKWSERPGLPHPGRGRSTEDAWAPEIVSKPSPPQSTASTPPSEGCSGHRLSAFGQMGDLLRSTGVLEPSDRQVACAMEEEEDGEDEDEEEEGGEEKKFGSERTALGDREMPAGILPRKSSISSVNGNAGSRRSSGVLTVTFEERVRSDLTAAGVQGGRARRVRVLPLEHQLHHKGPRPCDDASLIDPLGGHHDSLSPRPLRPLCLIQTPPNSNNCRRRDFHKLILQQCGVDEPKKLKSGTVCGTSFEAPFFIGLGVFTALQ